MRKSDWKVRGLLAAALIIVISIAVPPQVCPDLFEQPFSSVTAIRYAEQLGLDIATLGGQRALASVQEESLGASSETEADNQCLRTAPEICTDKPAASAQDVKQVMYFVNLKTDLFKQAEMKELPDWFKKRTPFITWSNGYVRSEEFYIDSLDGFLRKKGLMLRVRVDYSQLANQRFRTRSWITLKSGNNEIGKAPLLADKPEVMLQSSSDSKLYSTHRDLPYTPWQLGVPVVTPEDILAFIAESDPVMLDQLDGLENVGLENIGRTGNYLMITYSGGIVEGPFKGQNVAMQLWGKREEPPLVVDIRLEGTIEESKKLQEAALWLTEALGKEDLVSDEPVTNKMDFIFKDTSAFTPPLMDVRELP